jgi:hypothetical protein
MGFDSPPGTNFYTRNPFKYIGLSAQQSLHSL